MRMKNLVAAGLLSAAAAFGTPAVQAAPIQGAIGFSDGLTTTAGLPTSVVSTLTSYSPFLLSTALPCTGDFAAIGCPAAGSAFAFSLAGGSQLVFSVSTFQFTVETFALPIPTALSCTPAPGGGNLCTDALVVAGAGFVHDTSGVLEDSIIVIRWAFSGACSDTTGDEQCDSNWIGTYSATIVALGQPRQGPEPTTLLLIGAGILGLALIRRRKQQQV